MHAPLLCNDVSQASETEDVMSMRPNMHIHFLVTIGGRRHAVGLHEREIGDVDRRFRLKFNKSPYVTTVSNQRWVGHVSTR